jgi:gas vesicle protein
MSYAGKDPRSRRVADSESRSPIGRRSARGRVIEREIAIGRRGPAPVPAEPLHADEELDWQHIGIFAAGALIGAALGASAALLFAPQSGAETRHRLAHRGRRLRERTGDAWDDLRDELRYAARRGKRKIGRRWTRAKRDRRLQREFREAALAND